MIRTSPKKLNNAISAEGQGEQFSQRFACVVSAVKEDDLKILFAELAHDLPAYPAGGGKAGKITNS